MAEIRCVFFLLGAASMMKFWKNLTGPCGAPTYLPTYLPYLWETKKENMGGVKVGYTYQQSDGWWYSPATTVLPVTWQATLQALQSIRSPTWGG